MHSEDLRAPVAAIQTISTEPMTDATLRLLLENAGTLLVELARTTKAEPQAVSPGVHELTKLYQRLSEKVYVQLPFCPHCGVKSSHVFPGCKYHGKGSVIPSEILAKYQARAEKAERQNEELREALASVVPAQINQSLQLRIACLEDKIIEATDRIQQEIDAHNAAIARAEKAEGRAKRWEELCDRSVRTCDVWEERDHKAEARIKELEAQLASTSCSYCAAFQARATLLDQEKCELARSVAYGDARIKELEAQLASAAKPWPSYTGRVEWVPGPNPGGLLPIYGTEQAISFFREFIASKARLEERERCIDAAVDLIFKNFERVQGGWSFQRIDREVRAALEPKP